PAARTGAAVGLPSELPGSQLLLRTGVRQKTPAYTAAHLCAMAVLALVATCLGDKRDATATADFRTALEALPDQVAGVLAREDEVLPVAREATTRRVYAAGAGPNAVSATEAVIKVREAAYGWIDGLQPEPFGHGPMVPVNAV